MKVKTGIILIGVILLIFSGYSYYEGLSTETWPREKGTIEESYIKELGSSGTYASSTYIPKVEYVYIVSGRLYKGNKISVVDASYSSRKQARNAILKYHKNSEVFVYYDPKNPSKSVLIPGANGRQALLLSFLGVLLIMVAIFNHRIWGAVAKLLRP